MKELMSERMKGKIMETMKKNMLRNMMIVVLLALAGAMQATAVNYKNTYRGVQSTQYGVQSTVGYQQSAAGIQTTAPSATFQSTSSYSGQWNQDAQQSMLNADGTVNTDAYGIGRQNAPGMRKDPVTPGGGINPPDEEDDDEIENGTPIGDVVWPLMLLACAYALYKVRKWKEAVSQ